MRSRRGNLPQLVKQTTIQTSFSKPASRFCSPPAKLSAGRVLRYDAPASHASLVVAEITSISLDLGPHLSRSSMQSSMVVGRSWVESRDGSKTPSIISSIFTTYTAGEGREIRRIAALGGYVDPPSLSLRQAHDHTLTNRQ